MTGWHVNEVQGVIFVMGADDISVCQISRSSGVGTARLIAAAPAMLEGLKELHTTLALSCDYGYDEEVKLCDQLIKLAEGEE